MTIIELLEQTVTQYSTLPMLSMRIGFRTRTYSYHDAYGMAQATSQWLADNGVQPGDRVILIAPNSPFWIFVYWGTILRGAIIVPLTIQSTESQVQGIISQTDPRLIIKYIFYRFSHTHNTHLSNNSRIIDIDFLDELLIPYLNRQKYGQQTIFSNSSSKDLVEIMYTSGTTGDPKGVMLTHDAITTNILEVRKVLELKPGSDRLLSILPLSHIYEQTIGFLLAATYGAHTVYAHTQSAIVPLLQKYKITKLLVVPEFLHLVMSRIEGRFDYPIMRQLFSGWQWVTGQIPWFALRRFLWFPVLRVVGGRLDTIACGGAPLDPVLEAQWNRLGIIVLQGYGLTETSPVVSFNSYMHHKASSVGRIIGGITVRIASDGEIQVSGRSVFKGYYKDEQRTQAVFTPDGFFMTGDMGELDQDNFLYLRGRKKYMILGPGGQNVFPEDIEAVLNEQAPVRDSAVVGIERPGRIEIHAFLLLTDPRTDPKDIIAVANTALASYQQITGWTVWQESDFPRSAIQKVKKEELIKYIHEQERSRESHHAHIPVVSTPLMRILAHITHTPVTDITPEKLLVRDLQVDSLMRVEIVSRIAEQTGVALDETVINVQTTVQELQKHIDLKTGSPVQKAAHTWPRWGIICLLRRLLFFVIYGILRLISRYHVEGAEQFNAVTGPCIIMPNHTSYLDGVALWCALPAHIRNRTAFAAAKDVVYEEYWYLTWLIELLFNTFPFVRTENESIRPSLEQMGDLLETGYSIILFPEGKLSVTGELQPLKAGAGIVATQMGVPIVPVALMGTRDIVPYGALFPRKRGTIVVRFGKSIRYVRSDNHGQVTEKIFNNLKKLQTQEPYEL